MEGGHVRRECIGAGHRGDVDANGLYRGDTSFYGRRPVKGAPTHGVTHGAP